MATTLYKGPDFTIARDNDTKVTTVSIRADKVPNRHGYGYTVENGNITRSFGRLMARKYLTPAQGDSIKVSAAIDAFHVGTDLWRTYLVTGAA